MLMHIKFGKLISFTPKSTEKLKKWILSHKNRFSKKCPELQYNAFGASGLLFENQEMFCYRSGVIGYLQDKFF